jgi:cytochrome P450
MGDPVVDLSDPNSFREGFPHESFVWLRREAPLYWHEPTPKTPDGEGFWVISRYADVREIFQDPVRFSSETGGNRELGGTQLKDDRGAGVMVNNTDDPRHRRMRNLVNTGFTPRMIGRMEAELRERIESILDAVPAQGSFDFLIQVARELPLQAICSVLGVPQGDRAMLCDWVDEGIEADTGEVIAMSAHRKLGAYVRDLIADRRKAPTDDVISTIVHARIEGEMLSDRELRAFFSLLFPAGAETTRSAIAGGLLALIESPEQWTALKSQPELVKTAIEEIVRWTTPSTYKRRTATRDVVMYGQTIREGDKVTVWEASANRDEEVFPDPFRFDVARAPNNHVGFGHGVHFCLGAHLARLEIRITLEALLARFEGFEIAGKPIYRPNNRLVGLKSLPVRARPATR